MENLSQIEKSENQSIAVFKKEIGDFATLAILNIFIIDLIKFFNIGKQMNNDQVSGTSAIIMRKFYYWKPEDFKLCFQNCKEMKYGDGKLFDRLDGGIILSWMSEYDNERAEYFSNKRDLEHDKVKNNPLYVHVEIKNIYSKIRNELEKDINKESEYEKFKREYELSKLKQNAENNNGKD